MKKLELFFYVAIFGMLQAADKPDAPLVGTKKINIQLSDGIFSGADLEILKLSSVFANMIEDFGSDEIESLLDFFKRFSFVQFSWVYQLMKMTYEKKTDKEIKRALPTDKKLLEKLFVAINYLDIPRLQIILIEHSANVLPINPVLPGRLDKDGKPIRKN